MGERKPLRLEKSARRGFLFTGSERVRQCGLDVPGILKFFKKFEF